jgi:uncharacterized protein
MAKSEFATITIREFQKKDLKAYTLIEGFPGIGLVGTIAAKYLIEKLNFHKCGYIDSDIFIPVIRVREGKPIHPSRIFINEKKKLLIIISEQIIPHRFMDDFARAVVKWINDRGIKKVISLSGIRTEQAQEKRRVYGMAANDKSLQILKKNNVNIIKEGVTSGITALALLELKDTDKQAISLLGEVKLMTDYFAAAEILKTLNNILKLDIDVAPLLKEAKKVEHELTQFLESLKQEKRKVQELEPTNDKDGPSYYA